MGRILIRRVTVIQWLPSKEAILQLRPMECLCWCYLHSHQLASFFSCFPLQNTRCLQHFWLETGRAPLSTNSEANYGLILLLCYALPWVQTISYIGVHCFQGCQLRLLLSGNKEASGYKLLQNDTQQHATGEARKENQGTVLKSGRMSHNQRRKSISYRSKSEPRTDGFLSVP